MKAELFNSKTTPIPPIRRDVEIIPVQQNGSSFIYFYDARGYSNPDLALQSQVEPLLSLIDGHKSINDLEPNLGNDVSKNQVLEFVQFLDENRLLASAFFQQYARETEEQYEQSSIHQSVTAGSSYPADPVELRSYLDEAFANVNTQKKTTASSPKALYAPHIDPRVGLKSYAEAFSSIRDLKPKRVVILATSHYSGLYPNIYQDSPFILVNKDFEMPFGTIRRDQDGINELLADKTKRWFSTHDRAHRMEHSIELHLLLLSYLWQHEFEIIPFLVGGLDDLYYMKNARLGQLLNDLSNFLKGFEDDEDTFFLISGDLAHFGKKFGDYKAAKTLFSEVNAFDERFLECASKNQPQNLLALMKEEMDPYRICGFPPLYSFLQAMPHLEGEVLNYDLWDESERDSAVTFGSILYSSSE